MRLIQFNVYFNHYLHTLMTNYINYIVRLRETKPNSLIIILHCVRTFASALTQNTHPSLKTTA